MFYSILKVIIRIIIFPLFRIKVYGRENLPENKNYIFCGNHWSNWDPVFLGGAAEKKVHFMAKKELFSNKILSSIIGGLGAFPVDREKTDLKTLRYAVNLIKEGKVIGIFPEGTRVNEIKRENFKEGAGYVALKAKASIVPVEILSTYKPFHKTEIYFKKPLEIENYLELKSKEAIEKLMDDTCNSVYEKRKTLMVLKED